MTHEDLTLLRRTIALLSGMIDSEEVHTIRERGLKNNAFGAIHELNELIRKSEANGAIKPNFSDFHTEDPPSEMVVYRSDGSNGCRPSVRKTEKERETELRMSRTIIATNNSGIWSDVEVVRAKEELGLLTPKYIDGFGLMRMERVEVNGEKRVVFEISGGTMYTPNKQKIWSRIIPIVTDTSQPVRDFLIFVKEDKIKFAECTVNNLPNFTLPLYSVKINFKDNEFYNVTYDDLRTDNI